MNPKIPQDRLATLSVSSAPSVFPELCMAMTGRHFRPFPGVLRSAVGGLLLMAACPLPALTYHPVDLGTLGGVTSFALDVNNQRQVTGNSLVSADPGATGSLLRGFRYDGGTLTNLGALPDAATNRFARGFAINDSGVVVGEFNNDASRAFVYAGTSMTGLIRLAGDNDRGVANDINNAGLIVGSSSNGMVSRATLWTDSGNGYLAADLGTIAGTAGATGRAWAINQNGVVAGLSTNAAASPVSQATLWSSGTITNITSLGDGTRFSQAYALNDFNIAVGSSLTGQTVGQLIGTASTTAVTRAFRWENGVISELEPVNLHDAITNNGPAPNYHSVANDINNAGLIVGKSERISGSAAVATLWENGVAIDLNTLIPADSGWILRSAEGINEAGDIVGYGTFAGQSRAFLLTIPEASSATLAAMGMAAIFRRRRRC